MKVKTKDKTMKMKTTDYVAPEIECIEMMAEGVLCGSVDTVVEDGGDAFSLE